MEQWGIGAEGIRMGEEGYAQLRAALDAVDQGFAVFRAERGADGAVVGLDLEVLNRLGAHWLKVDPVTATGQELTALRPEAVRIGLWSILAATAADGDVRRERMTVPAGSGELTLQLHVAAFGADRVVLTARDITERVTGEKLLTQAHQQTANARATLQTALDATSDAFAVYDVVRDRHGQIDRLRLVMINAAGAAPLDQRPQALVGWDLREVDPAAESSGLWAAIEGALAQGRTRGVRVHRHDDDGHWIASIDTTVAPVGAERVVLTWRDVTEDERRGRDLARAHDQAWHAATHDPLTGLANRALLTEQVHEALWSADADHRAAIVFLDLDRFKEVNDGLGHAAGDDLLRVVAARLAGVIRGGDLAARLGGDEFVLLLRNVRQEWDTEQFLGRVRRVMEQPVLLSEAVVVPVASYGVAITPPGPRDLDALLREADTRMYADKLSRR